MGKVGTPRRKNFPGDVRGCSKCGTEITVTDQMCKYGKYICSGCNVKGAKLWRLKNLERHRELQKKRKPRTRKKNPERSKAHNAVVTAKRNGTLVPQPCEKCGDEYVQAHHDDYSKPLDVRWMCHRCHQKEHGRFIDDPSALIAELEKSDV